jgi:hypothetical protein
LSLWITNSVFSRQKITSPLREKRAKQFFQSKYTNTVVTKIQNFTLKADLKQHFQKNAPEKIILENYFSEKNYLQAVIPKKLSRKTVVSKKIPSSQKKSFLSTFSYPA